MYYLYEKTVVENKVIFKQFEYISLAGCESGVIVKYLRRIITDNETEPYEWCIPITDMIKGLSLNGNSIVIDIKPNDKKSLFLFEIVKIWGYSNDGWTPILLELKEIFSDENINVDKTNFSVVDYNGKTTVFTFLYLMGSIKNGEIMGTWRFPGPSPTNSVLLWPDALKYFKDKLYKK